MSGLNYNMKHVGLNYEANSQIAQQRWTFEIPATINPPLFMHQKCHWLVLNSQFAVVLKQSVHSYTI